MSYNEFWNGDPELVIAYREADRIKRENNNFNLWLQGKYFYEAICCASPLFHDFAKGELKPVPFLKHPFPLSEKEAMEYRETEQKERMEKMLAKMNHLTSESQRE